MLPSSYIISAQLLDIIDRPVASGGSGDLYEGTLGGSKVCVKRFRAYPMGEPTDPAQVRYFFIAFPTQLPTRSVDRLPGGHGVGAPRTPKCRLTPWYHPRSSAAYF